MSPTISGIALALQTAGRPPDFDVLFYIMPHKIELTQNGKVIYCAPIDRMESQFSDRAAVFVARFDPVIPTQPGDIVSAFIRPPGDPPPGAVFVTPESIRKKGLQMATSMFYSSTGEGLQDGPEFDAFIRALENLL